MTITDSEISDEIALHLNSVAMVDQIAGLQRNYELHDFAEITHFMPEPLFSRALDELNTLFETMGKRRDLVVKQSGNTPRKYTNLDRDTLASGSSVIPLIFRSQSVYDYLSEITRKEMLPVPYVPEEFIAARLHKAGDVHGWHWDDYTWALVWIFKMPDVSNGGSLEYIKRVDWNPDDPRIDEIVAAGPIERRHPAVGSAYLLKADTALHRVSPLAYDDERMIVCYSYATPQDLSKDVDHESMESLYPESHARHEGPQA